MLQVSNFPTLIMQKANMPSSIQCAMNKNDPGCLRNIIFRSATIFTIQVTIIKLASIKKKGSKNF